MIEVDSVRYGDGSFWSTNANGTGMSLQRLSESDYADEPLNWIAAASTPASFNGYNSMDSDGDGLPTVWEIYWGLDPDVNTGDDGALGDPDDDGVTNLDEFRANTDPNDPTDPDTENLQLALFVAGDGSIRVRFNAAPGRQYLLQSTANLNLPNWQTIDEIPASSSSVQVEEIVPSSPRASFFRVLSPHN